MFYYDLLLWVSVRKKDQQPHTSLQSLISTHSLCYCDKSSPFISFLLLLTFTGCRESVSCSDTPGNIFDRRQVQMVQLCFECKATILTQSFQSENTLAPDHVSLKTHGLVLMYFHFENSRSELLPCIQNTVAPSVLVSCQKCFLVYHCRRHFPCIL